MDSWAWVLMEGTLHLERGVGSPRIPFVFWLYRRSHQMDILSWMANPPNRAGYHSQVYQVLEELELVTSSGHSSIMLSPNSFHNCINLCSWVSIRSFFKSRRFLVETQFSSRYFNQSCRRTVDSVSTCLVLSLSFSCCTTDGCILSFSCLCREYCMSTSWLPHIACLKACA